MTTTYAELINEITLNLSGYTMRQERTTHLTEDLSNTGLTMKLRDVANIGKGVIEIGEELIWIDSYDRNSNTATIAPYGRGYQGTAAVAHTAGTKVTVAPTFPRTAVKRAINQTISAVFPRLYAVGSYEITYSPSRTAYQIPADVQTITSVTYQRTGSSKEWTPVRSWRPDVNASTTAFTTGQSISIYDALPAGRKIRIVYTKMPALLTTSAEDAVFETVTGLQTSMRDVITYGACSRLASFIDAGRLNYTSAEADQADTKLQYGSASSTARYFTSLYNQRLAEEEGKMRDMTPTRIHYTRY